LGGYWYLIHAAIAGLGEAGPTMTLRGKRDFVHQDVKSVAGILEPPVKKGEFYTACWSLAENDVVLVQKRRGEGQGRILLDGYKKMGIIC
jgi:hypothetical protein